MNGVDRIICGSKCWLKKAILLHLSRTGAHRQEDQNLKNAPTCTSVKTKWLTRSRRLNIWHQNLALTQHVLVYGVGAMAELWLHYVCLLYTSDAADDLLCVDLGGR